MVIPFAWIMDDYSLMYCLRYGIRFFQYLGFFICRQVYRFEDALLGSRIVYDDDKRFWRCVGKLTSGILIGKFFTDADGAKDWHSIWLCFAAYALVVAVLFAILFRYKHTPEAETEK